jgi:REP element-mobilizing transposase RayT
MQGISVVEVKRGTFWFILWSAQLRRCFNRMPRTARASVGGVCDHVLNRGNARDDVFHKDGDFAAFVKLIALANERLPMRVLVYCLLNNHFHLVVWPHHDGDLSRWMQWLLMSHVRRYHRQYGSSGHAWQGRFQGVCPSAGRASAGGAELG